LLVCEGGKELYLWQGLGANEAELALGSKLIERFGAQATVKMTIKEGEEPLEFWNGLGGKTEYSSIKDTGRPAGFEPRLFHCSNASGYYFVEEIYNFT
jgi:hypothetical protein